MRLLCFGRRTLTSAASWSTTLWLPTTACTCVSFVARREGGGSACFRWLPGWLLVPSTFPHKHTHSHSPPISRCWTTGPPPWRRCLTCSSRSGKRRLRSTPRRCENSGGGSRATASSHAACTTGPLWSVPSASKASPRRANRQPAAPAPSSATAFPYVGEPGSSGLIFWI